MRVEFPVGFWFPKFPFTFNFKFTARFNIGFIPSSGHTSNVPHLPAQWPSSQLREETKEWLGICGVCGKSEVKVSKEEEEEREETKVERNDFWKQNGER